MSYATQLIAEALVARNKTRIENIDAVTEGRDNKLWIDLMFVHVPALSYAVKSEILAQVTADEMQEVVGRPVRGNDECVAAALLVLMRRVLEFDAADVVEAVPR